MKSCPMCKEQNSLVLQNIVKLRGDDRVKELGLYYFCKNPYCNYESEPFSKRK